ncbi:MAG: hypothetical protein R3D59_13570 [Paracoccaceae bacterium]
MKNSALSSVALGELLDGLAILLLLDLVEVQKRERVGDDRVVDHEFHPREADAVDREAATTAPRWSGWRG